MNAEPTEGLHDIPLPTHGWWACSHPERPYDAGTWWDERCRSCVIAMGAAARLLPEMGIFNEDSCHKGTLEHVYEAQRVKFDLPAVRPPARFGEETPT